MQGEIAIEYLKRPVSESDLCLLAQLLVEAVESGAVVCFLVARDAEGIVGTVQLHPVWAPHQPHRADVMKLLVHRRGRRSGIGTRLMKLLDTEARAAGWEVRRSERSRGLPSIPTASLRTMRLSSARSCLKAARREVHMAIRVVRLGSARDKGEGIRIGTVRRPPRGVAKKHFSSQNWYDVWFPTLAPAPYTVKLGKGASTDAQWNRFTKRYRSEMSKPEARHALELLATLSRRVNFSVGCYCENEARCHRSVLRALLVENGADVE